MKLIVRQNKAFCLDKILDLSFNSLAQEKVWMEKEKRSDKGRRESDKNEKKQNKKKQ